jgi:hypothetical protein
MIEQAKELIKLAEAVVEKHDSGTLAKARGDSKAIEQLREAASQMRWAVWEHEEKHKQS